MISYNNLEYLNTCVHASQKGLIGITLVANWYLSLLQSQPKGCWKSNWIHVWTVRAPHLTLGVCMVFLYLLIMVLELNADWFQVYGSANIRQLSKKHAVPCGKKIAKVHNRAIQASQGFIWFYWPELLLHYLCLWCTSSK